MTAFLKECVFLFAFFLSFFDYGNKNLTQNEMVFLEANNN